MKPLIWKLAMANPDRQWLIIGDVTFGNVFACDAMKPEHRFVAQVHFGDKNWRGTYPTMQEGREAAEEVIKMFIDDLFDE